MLSAMEPSVLRTVGARIKFDSERQRYTVMASNGRFVILTKPFNARKTYLYTIVDMERGVRGACDLIFGLPCDVNSPEGAAEALAWIERGDMGVSRRNVVDLSSRETAALMTAQGMEAATADKTRSGLAEGDSPVGQQADAPLPHQETPHGRD